MSIKISNNLSIRVNLNQENTLCVERHFERKSVRPFDTKTASCAFCVSKGGGCFSRIGNQRSQWHFARNLSRPFDIKTASCAFCVSKGSGVLTRQQHQAQASLQQSSLRLDFSRRSSYIAVTVQESPPKSKKQSTKLALFLFCSAY